MHIGFITYEYPPDIAKGGIATYVEQMANILADRGHNVEIFCGSHTRNFSEIKNKVFIHRCLVKDSLHFKVECLPKFIERHQFQPFDIIESPEINADALLIKENFPTLPLVVKLHMASFIQMRFLNFYTSKIIKIRYFLGGLRRGRINFYGSYNYRNDSEYKFTKLAEGIVAPSISQKKITLSEWHFLNERIEVIPHPYVPKKAMLNIPVSSATNKVVTFIGKLNVHKGIVNLVKAIPLVIKHHPDVLFNLIGNDSYFGVKKMNMSAFIKQELKGFERNYVLKGGIEYEKLYENFENTSLCVFPSLWECFGLVCLEAMSAGRPVIGSKEGGMKDILDNNAGVLIDPHNYREIAKEIIKLLDDKYLCFQLGKNGRAKVLSKYNAEKIGLMAEKYYRNTIDKSNRTLTN